MSNLIIAGFLGCIMIVMAIFLCMVVARIIIQIGQLILVCYECCLPEDNRRRIWHIGCCCFDVFINCSEKDGAMFLHAMILRKLFGINYTLLCFTRSIIFPLL